MLETPSTGSHCLGVRFRHILRMPVRVNRSLPGDDLREPESDWRLNVKLGFKESRSRIKNAVHGNQFALIPDTRRMRTLALCAVLLTGSWTPGLADVQIEGLGAALLENAIAHLTLDDEACEAPTWRVQERFADAANQIRTSLEALGYYDATVASRLESGEDCWSARFDVEPGEPVVVRSVDFSISGEAQGDAQFEAPLSGGELVPGAILRHAAYEQFKRQLLDLASAKGYVDALYTTSRLDVYPVERAADVTLYFESGPRYRFGAIELQQNVLSEQLLQYYFDFSPGDFYDADKLTDLYAALTGSGYFDQVDIQPLGTDPVTREIALRVDLQPRTRRRHTYGLGFSTDTGPRFRMGHINTRRNERGHQSSMDLQVSPVISELSLTYRLPYGDPRSEWLSFQSGIKHENTETSSSDSLKFGVRRLVPLQGNWRHSQFVDYLLEDYTVGRQQSRSRLLIPGVDWTRLVADDTLRASAGHRLSFSLRGASDSLGSDTSYVQAALSAKRIWSLPNAARILVRGELGATWGDDFNALPPSVRFFAGGDTSVRGYEFESLGPVDAHGQVVGGTSLAVASIEYEHSVRPRWSVAAFVDSGDAFRAAEFVTHTGAGVGLRWQSPLGPIRIDVAKPLDGDDRNPRLHISLGPDL